jgi:hypothetical protein
VRDEARNGETFEDFCNHEMCKQCNLEPSHVLALRLYSTAVYKSINMPLRDTKRTGPHPLAITVASVATNPNPKPDLHPSPSPSPNPKQVAFVDEGVRRLRAVGAQASGA